MCKLCVSCGSVRGNPSVSGCWLAAQFECWRHMLSTISTLLSTLQHFYTVLFSAAGYDTPHNYWASLYMVTLKRAVLSRGGSGVCNRRSCQTMDSVGAPWAVRFKCNPHHRSVTPIQWPITAPPAAPCQCTNIAHLICICPGFYNHRYWG